MEENLVSIITPVYNCEKYIRETIESVISQTYKNWEMILVDDMSVDKSCEIINEYVKMDNRIKLIRLSKNSGAANARNNALKIAKGRFLAFLDGDDLWNENKLQVQIEYMLLNNAAFSYSDYEVISDDGKSTNRIVKVPKQMTYKQYLSNTIIQTVTVVIDKKYVGEVFMPNISMRQDFATWLSILKRGFLAYGINEVLGKYRRATNSLSSNKFRTMKKNWYVYRKIEKLNLLYSIKCFLCYAFFATVKRIKILKV